LVGPARRIALACMAGAALVLASGAQAACRQALALGLDVSGSVDAFEYRLQLDGLAAALDSAPVRELLLAGPGVPEVRMAIFEWSGAGEIRLIVPWETMSDPATHARVVAHLRNTVRRRADDSTALGSALLQGWALLEEQADCWVRTLDLSGDGRNNTGPPPETVGPPPPGVTVNGLVIGNARVINSPALRELAEYYRTHVISGPGAFVEVARGFLDFEEAMQRKLMRELAPVVLGNTQ